MDGWEGDACRCILHTCIAAVQSQDLLQRTKQVFMHVFTLRCAVSMMLPAKWDTFFKTGTFNALEVKVSTMPASEMPQVSRITD